MALELWRPGPATRRSLFREFDREMAEVMEHFFGDRPWPRLVRGTSGFTPPLDMVDREEEMMLRVDLPGLEQKDIEVTVEEGMLTVKGTRKEEREPREEDYYARERWAGAFTRSVMLPPGLEPEKMKAIFRNGVLEVHVPKTKEAKSKKIEIKVE
jgi:HSP20 family protein